MLRAGAPCDRWRDGRRIDDYLAIKPRIFVGEQGAPVRDCLIKGLALRRERPAAQVSESLLVRRDHPIFSTQFHRQIADGESAFDRHGADRGARVFNGVTRASGSADLSDQMQDEILWRHTRTRRALESHAHQLRLVLTHGLGGEGVRAFGVAHSKCQGTQSAVGASVAVATYERQAGQHEPQLGTRDMDDALSSLPQIKKSNAALAGVFLQRVMKPPAELEGLRVAAGRAGNGVIGHGEGELRTANWQIAFGDLGQRRRSRKIVQKMAVDMQQRPAAAQIAHHVRIPDLFEQRARHGYSFVAKRWRNAFHSSAPKRRNASMTVASLGADGATPDSLTARNA